MNQNDLRAAMNSVSNMTDRELFTCPSMAEFFNTFTAGVTKLLETEIKVRLVWNENAPIAYSTDRREVFLNAENAFTKGCDRKTRFTIMKGLALHENGHLLFTNFRLFRKRIEKLLKGEIYPSDGGEVIAKAEKVLQGANTELLQVAASLLSLINNVIEDGFIEFALLGLCKGYSRNLTYLRKLQSENLNENWDEQISKGIAEPDVMTNCILGYAKYGLDLVPRDDSDPAKVVFAEILADIDRAIEQPDPTKRATAVNAVFARLFLFYYETNNQDQKQNENGNGDDKDSSQDGQGGQENNADAQGNGDSSSGNNTESKSQQGASENKEQNGNGTDHSQKGQSGQENGTDTQKNGGSSNGNDAKGQQDRKDNAGKDHGAEDGNAQNDVQNDSESAGNESSRSLTDMMKRIVENGAKHLRDESSHDDIDSSAPGSSRDQQGKLLKNMPDMKNRHQDVKEPSSEAELNAVIKAEKDRVASEEAEKNIRKELQEIKNAMQLNLQGLNAVVERSSLGSMAKYMALKKEMLPISKRMQAELIKKIEDKRNGQNMKRLYTGRHLDVSGLCQHDGKAFSRNIDPEDFPDMAVSILIDMSGSMRRNEKDALAEKAAFVTHDFCRSLHIPVSIYGHHVVNNKIKLTSFAEFASIDGKDAQRIAKISSLTQGCNRDGYALRFCAEHLIRQNNDVKILFVLSDGLPSAYSRADEALRDMHEVLNEYSKKGVIFIVAGIASDNEQLMVYYSSERYHAHFLDITDLKRLPKQFVKILKKRLEKSL